MRYATPLFFVKKGQKKYDPDSGTWTEGAPVRTKKYANVTHMSAERQQAVFGDVCADRFIARLQRAYTKDYDCIEINGERYTVDTKRTPGDRQSLVVMKNGGD